MFIREITEGEKADFNRLAPHVCQSWEWGSFRLQTGTVPKILRLGFYENRKLVRAYQLFFHIAPKLNRPIGYLPRSLSPSAEDLEALKKICREVKAVYLKLEPDETEGKINDPLAVRGRNILPPHSLLLNISGTEEEILAQMHEKTRYNIKVAQKHGITVVSQEDPESLEAFIKLHGQTQKRQGFYSHYPEYYRTLWNTLRPQNMVHLLCAYLPSANHQPLTDPIAALMLFSFNGVLYFPYGGWSAEHREKMPNNLLHFEAIRLGKQLGCTVYDMWSSYRDTPKPSDPWYGTYIFKKGFGGREVNYVGSWDIPFDRNIYTLINTADSLRIKTLHLRRKLGI